MKVTFKDNNKIKIRGTKDVVFKKVIEIAAGGSMEQWVRENSKVHTEAGSEGKTSISICVDQEALRQLIEKCTTMVPNLEIEK
jgi:hypothetical protein